MDILQNEIEIISPEKKREIETDLADVTSKANELVVKDDESFGKAANYLTWINDRQKGIESFRLAIVKPLKDHIKKIDDFFNGMKESFDIPKNKIIGLTLAYRAELAKEARIHRDDAPAKTLQGDLGSVSYVKTAEFEITQLGKLPDEFWTPDEKKIGARVRELTKDLQVGKSYTNLIPGVRVFCTERPSIKRA